MTERNQTLATVCWLTTAILATFFCFTQLGVMLSLLLGRIGIAGVAPVALVKRVAAGEGVSYGHTWTAPADTTIALIPLGYADGIPRALSGRFDVAIGGTRYPAVGRVCMDQFLVNLGDDASMTDTDSGETRAIRAGDDAVIVGPAAVLVSPPSCVPA